MELSIARFEHFKSHLVKMFKALKLQTAIKQSRPVGPACHRRRLIPCLQRRGSCRGGILWPVCGRPGMEGREEMKTNIGNQVVRVTWAQREMGFTS